MLHTKWLRKIYHTNTNQRKIGKIHFWDDSVMSSMDHSLVKQAKLVESVFKKLYTCTHTHPRKLSQRNIVSEQNIYSRKHTKIQLE